MIALYRIIHNCKQQAMEIELNSSYSSIYDQKTPRVRSAFFSAMEIVNNVNQSDISTLKNDNFNQSVNSDNNTVVVIGNLDNIDNSSDITEPMIHEDAVPLEIDNYNQQNEYIAARNVQNNHNMELYNMLNRHSGMSRENNILPRNYRDPEPRSYISYNRNYNSLIYRPQNRRLRSTNLVSNHGYNQQYTVPIPTKVRSNNIYRLLGSMAKDISNIPHNKTNYYRPQNRCLRSTNLVSNYGYNQQYTAAMPTKVRSNNIYRLLGSMAKDISNIPHNKTNY